MTLKSICLDTIFNRLQKKHFFKMASGKRTTTYSILERNLISGLSDGITQQHQLDYIFKWKLSLSHLSKSTFQLIIR